MSLMMFIVRKMVKKNSAGFFDNADINVPQVRATLADMIAKNSKSQKTEKDVCITFGKIDSIDISFCTPKNWNERDLIYYVHGGGLITGDHKFSLPYASQLAAFSGSQVVSINYRLAPEHPFPAALDDSFCIYKNLIEKYRIALIGESGGAYLSFAIALKCKMTNTVLPTCIVINSIPADFSGFIKKVNTKREVTVTVEGLQALYKMYAGNEDSKNELVNVIFGDYSGFPPVRVIYDEDEVLAPDSIAVIEKLQKAGVNVEYEKYKGTFHAFTTTGKIVAESRSELIKSTNFIKRNFEI
jgi:acetyl esterase/lipase